jgi:nitrogen regulatory protein P-II 1
MTRIEVVVRPWRLDDVKRAVEHPWVTGITVSEVKGFGGEGGHRARFRGSECDPGMEPKLRIEIVIPDPLAPRLVHDLERSLRTGEAGDGQLFVTRIEEAIRIRTGERGEGAL